MGTRQDDSAWINRHAGMQQAISDWNNNNYSDPAKLHDPYFAGVTLEGGRAAGASIIDDEEVDGIVCAGGGGEPLIGLLSMKEMEKKKPEEISQEVKDDKANTQKAIDEQKDKKQQLIADYAQKNDIVHQLIDLALLQNGMLKGEALDKFLSRSVELIK